MRRDEQAHDERHDEIHRDREMPEIVERVEDKAAAKVTVDSVERAVAGEEAHDHQLHTAARAPVASRSSPPAA